jgi:hypothetical protein
MSQAALTSIKALNSRRKRPIKRRGRTLSSSARGAQPHASHGPLERLLERTHRLPLCAPRAGAASQTQLPR